MSGIFRLPDPFHRWRQRWFVPSVWQNGRRNNAEGGTHGEDVTALNSGGLSGAAFDSVNVTAGTLTYDNTRKNSGQLAIKSARDATAGTTNNSLQWNLASGGRHKEIYFRGYFNFDTIPSVARAFLTFSAGGNVAMRVYVDPSSIIYMVDDADSLISGTQSAAIAADTWYRLEIKLRIGDSTTDGQIEYTLWDGTTLVETNGVGGVNFGTNNFIDGVITAGADPGDALTTAWTIWMDDLGYDWYEWLGETIKPLDNDVEGETDGVTVTSVNSGSATNDAFNTTNNGAPDTAPAGTLTFENTPVIKGAMAIRSDKTVTSGHNNVAWNDTSMGKGNQLYFRSYFAFANAPSSNAWFINFYNIGAFIGGILMSTGGQIWLANNASVAQHGLSAGAYNDGQVYRLEVWLRTNGMWEWSIYAGDSTTPLETWRGHGAAFGALITAVRIGASHTATTHTWDLSFDDVGVNEVGWLGPTGAVASGQKFMPVVVAA